MQWRLINGYSRAVQPAWATELRLQRILLGLASVLVPVACLASMPIGFGIWMTSFDDPHPHRSPLLDGLVAIDVASIVALFVAWIAASSDRRGALARRATVGCTSVSVVCAAFVIYWFFA